MSKIILLLAALVALPAWAESRKFDVVTRNGEGKLENRQVVLKDLLSDQAFEGVYFRVVAGREEKALAFDGTDPEMLLRAATAYHYLTVAREAYVGILSALGDQPQLRSRLTVRIDQETDFSEVSHFTTQKVRNGALSIAASDLRDALDGVSWDPEIWFFKAEKIRFAPGADLADKLNSQEFKLPLLLAFFSKDAESAARDIILDRFYYEPHLYSVAISFGLSELLPIAIEQSLKRFKTTVFVEAALIPEIIVHEYGHHALGPWLGFKQRTHLVEGFPNYFAGRILGLKDLQARSRPFSRGFSPRRGQSRAGYSLDEEYGLSAATSSFTYALLNDLEEALGPNGLPVILRSLEYIDRSSSLKPDFENAVLRAVSEIVPRSRPALLKASEVFRERGM